MAFDTNGELVAGGGVPRTKQTGANLRRILGQAGRTLDNGIKCNVWRADARGFSGCKKLNTSIFPNTPPARATGQSPLMINAKVEIDCIGHSLRWELPRGLRTR